MTLPALCAADLQQVVADDEPRILDVRLAERLEFKAVRQIRELIGRNAKELERYGPLSYRTTMVGIGSGAQREVGECWLNEAQAILLCMKAKTLRAADARQEIIAVFMAWRQGRLQLVDATHVVLTQGAVQEILGHTAANTRAIGELQESHQQLRTEVREIKDNVIYLANSVKPKKEDFSDKDWEVWRRVIKESFNGKDPVLGERKIIDSDGNWLDGIVPDHYNREKAGYKNGWPTFQDINLKLREQLFRDSKAHRFKFFQDEVDRLFPNGPRNWLGKSKPKGRRSPTVHHVKQSVMSW